ncbi:MAG: hypothetical protein V4736_12585, partial [Bdellovibrionota bacterium]
PSFINKFQAKGYDFQMAITTSDAYLSYHTGEMDRSKYKNVIMDKNTPDLINTFMSTVKVGTGGSGDERVFMSMKAFLDNPLNNGFLRPGSTLAVIMVSDEEDFSHDDYQNGTSSYFFTESYREPTLYQIPDVQTFLDLKTNSTPTAKNYSVNTISIMDTACKNQLASSTQKVNQRLVQLADATKGYKGSLCKDFAEVLAGISDKVLSGSSVFQLASEPIPESIRVSVNGVTVVEDATNGWSYDPVSNSISLNGTAIPAAGSDIRVGYDPKEVKI